MATVIIAVFAIALIAFFQVWIDSLFFPLYDWLDGSIIEIEEDDLIDYMDNSEYDWGHNVKGYRYDD